MRRLYPIFLDLSRRWCVVVGGGEVAERKAAGLLASGAEVTVIAPSVTSKIRRMAGSGKLRLRERRFIPGDLKKAFIAVCATDDAALNARIARMARRRGVLVNVADCPGLCDFYLPSVLRRGRLQIAVSTGGKSPSLAKSIRLELESRYGKEYGALTELLGRIRGRIVREVPGASLVDMMRGPAMRDLLKRGRGSAALAEANRIIDAFLKKGERRARHRR